MKKHLFLLTTDITLDGGVERVVCNLANSFTRHNYDVDIISIFKSDNDVKYTVDNLVTVKYLFEEESYASFMRHVPLSKIQLIWRYLLAIKFTHPLYKYICSVLKPGQKGIILCNSYLITPLYRHKDIKIIGLDHSRYPFQNLTKGYKHWLHTYMVRKFDIITTLNVDELSKWKTLGKPVVVMPNFIPVNENRGENVIREKTVLSLGRMNTPQKGFDRLIEIYAKIALKHSDWTLKIFGSGKYQPTYIKQINDLNLQNYIKIYDFTESPDLEYKKASIYAMTSREEGFGMVLLEAGLSGLPLIAYDVEFGPKTIIKDGETGFVIQNGDTNAFACALEKLMVDNELRSRMSASVKEDIKNRYSENIIMERWINLINTL